MKMPPSDQNLTFLFYGGQDRVTGYQGLPFEGVFVESHVEVFNLTRPFLALLNDLVPTFSEAWVTVTESCRRDHLKYQENNDDS